MRKKRAEIQVFSVSFLDVLSCALGGVLILLMVVMNKPEKKEGFVVPIALVFRIDWDKKIDIDLWIQDPATAKSGGYVFHGNLRSKAGSLMRDVQAEQDQQWEVYFSATPHPGVYEVYAHYYTKRSLEPVTLTWQAVLFAGDPEREQLIESEGPIVLRKAVDGKTPGRLLGKFKLLKQGSDYELRKMSD